MLFLCGGGKISAGYRNHGKVRVKHMTQIDKNIAFNLKRIRKSKNMSLDMLAERTGVSKSMLGQENPIPRCPLSGRSWRD